MKIATRVAKVDNAKCIGCRACEVHCPANAIKVKKNTGEPFTPACQNACPAGVYVPGYVALAGAGRIREAYQLILRDNPFPSVCGRICTHPCQLQCSRGQHDEPVAIMDVKRYIADYAFENGLDAQAVIWPNNGKSVGIIGAGPSGLSCAYYLALTGYSVEVYESQPGAGGVLLYGIPQYRLPKEILARDIGAIEKTGVKIHLSTEVGKDISFDELKKKHDAVYIATGTQFSKKVGILGEELQGIYHGLDFLRDVNLNKSKKIGRKVVVIGGGNTAIDAARVAVRLGAESVTILYRRRIPDMPADQREVTEAMVEGVKVISLAAPVEFIGSGKVEGIRCVRMSLEDQKDSTGRHRTKELESSEFILEADMVIPAVSQYSDLPFISKDEVKVTDWGSFVVDEKLMTTIPGVFSGGDVARGSDIAITAIADGKKAAQSIHAYVTKQGVINQGPEVAVPNRVEEIDWAQNRKSEMRHLPLSERKSTFAEAALGLTEEQIWTESQRCFSCVGKAKVAEDICVDCELCVEFCNCDAVKMVPREEPLTFGTQVREEQREQILEICKKARLYPLEFGCTCNAILVEEMVAAILNGARTMDDLTKATGMRSGCGGICCTSNGARLLKAAGHQVEERPEGQWHYLPLSLWDIPQEVADKYPVLRINKEQKRLWNPEICETVETAWGLNKEENSNG